MRVCVFGAGAVGGYVAAMLLRQGDAEVSVVVRGAHMQAIRDRGLELRLPDESFVVKPHAVTDCPERLPPQDIVFVTLKSHAQSAAAPALARLLAPAGHVVFMNNGIPWWWNYRGISDTGGALPLLDPDAALWHRLGPQRALGCVLYSGNSVVAPGVIRHLGNNRWLLGEPDGSMSSRLTQTVALLAGAGLRSQACDDLRQEVWRKLLRNASMNILCALTRTPIDGLASDEELLGLYDALIRDVVAVAGAQGFDLTGQVDAARRAPSLGGAIDGGKLHEAQPSMLQDVLAGRPLEIEAILGQIQAFAREACTPCPAIDAVLPLVRALDRSAHKL